MNAIRKRLERLGVKWNRRPWPSSLAELRALRVSFSQFAEDLLVTTLLGYETTDGFYVDVGCFHPITYSNTFIFYRRGWRGLCIDPSPSAAAIWRTARPRDRFESVGIAERPGELLYLSSSRYPACNRLVRPEQLDQIDASSFDHRTTVAVEPLARVLERALPAPAPVLDLMSIDCEGLDLEVLRSNDFERFRPRVMIVEDHEARFDSAIVRHCAGLGYSLSCVSHLSKIFVDSVR